MTTVSAVPRHPPPLRGLLLLLCVFLSVLLAGYSWLMLQWPLVREAHFLHYIGYLINEHGFAPYRDVLETSWFGTLLFHTWVGKLFGYSALGFRTADLLLLALLLGVSWQVMRAFNALTASVTTLTLGLVYLHYGPANTLQRDYLILLPVMTALWAAMQTAHAMPWRAFIVGACFGAAASIKPHAVIGMPAILALLHTQTNSQEKSVAHLLALAGAGGVITFGSGLLWLWWRGGLTAFINMSLHYLPLYQDMNGAHQMTTATERWHNTLHWWLIFLWLWPAALPLALWRGLALTQTATPQRALVWTLAALTLCYNIYPLPAGKFWDYHWIPFTWFASLTASLLLLPAARRAWHSQTLALLCLLSFLYVFSSQYFPGRGLIDQIRRYPNIAIDVRYEDEIAAFLRAHLMPGDTIQTIDQGGPATIYLLQAEAVIATPYLGHFQFLHHVQTPYVQHAQQDFLQRIADNPPKLFLVMNDFTRPSGINTIERLPGVREFIESHYDKLRTEPGFVIWHRRDAVPAPAAMAN